MKKILLPTDFSENAWNAIVYTLHFFRDESCKFYILHTYMPPFYRADYLMGGPGYSAIPDVGVDRVQEGLDNILSYIKKNFKNTKHRFKTLSAINTLTDEVQAVTEREKIDLIAMGTQGATGAREIFIGTKTVHVIRRAAVPVLVVPTGYRFREVGKVLFPSDLEVSLTKGELKLLNEVVKMHRAELYLLHVLETKVWTKNQEKNKQFLMNYFRNTALNYLELKDETVPEAIYRYIDVHNIQLLAMMNRKHAFLERLMVKRNVGAVGYHTRIPFLVMPQIE